MLKILTASGVRNSLDYMELLSQNENETDFSMIFLSKIYRNTSF